MADPSPTTNYHQSEEATLNIFAYMFAGLAMMLNIRLSYSAAPYALLRFKLPENLFSVFVRTTSSALELWCLPSMLLGNIMEQVYNHTQEIQRVHATGINNYEVKTKAGKLKTNAGGQSKSELASTKNTDLDKSNNAQNKLEAKANELAQKALELHNGANTLEGAASSSPLLPLKGDAKQLKTAAKKGSTGLYEKAEALAARAGQGGGATARGHAHRVIGAFDNVEKLYDKLMGKANESKLTNHPNVTAVIKAYLDAKNTYYQMLITYRIQQKAIKFHEAAEALQNEAAGASAKEQPDNTLLKALHTHANAELDDLVKKAEALKGINADTIDATIVTNYLAVDEAYGTLMEKVKEQKAEEVPQVKGVKEKFISLEKSYVNVLRLRVQELAKKSEELKEKANELKTRVDELRQQATLLANAASQDGSDGLQQKALLLVQAIKTDGGDDGSKATDVIKRFETVTKAYNEISKQPKYQQLLDKANEQEAKGTSLPDDEEQNVKDVYDAYKDLKAVYDEILKFTKIKYYSGELYTAVDRNASDAIINFNAVVTVYKLLGETEYIVKTDFENLQEEYSNAIYFYKKCIITIPSMFTNWLNFLTFVILFIVYVTGGDQGSVTGYYWIMAASGFVFGINMVLVYAVDYRYLPYYIAGENSFPIVTSAILYFATSIFGNRRKYNSDYLVVLIDISISIFIALVASVLWTVAFHKYRAPKASPDTPNWPVISPVLLVIVGMGLVYSIYPGIAPGMIVPFYLIDKIEMVLLILTTFPPLIFAFTTKYAPSWSPKTEFLLHSYLFKFGGWTKYNADKPDSGWPPQEGAVVYGWIWHFFDILAPLQIILAVIFVYSIHYRDSSISRSIVNQPKMSTFLTIIFYMCHEIMLATGFPGLVCNGGVTHVLLPTQWIGALLMVLLAFYSIGYITEYKRHDPSEWPTDGMTKWNALCYWLKMASKITNKNFKQLFTTDLGRNLLIFIFYKVI
ncbi:Tpr-related protein family member, putative [Theileria annulata]|uniref:Tpr-related protein family member, putative n=1 Tax=Theileria annulata TaxID=5874 RepID=Q4UI34_THEAN|nr:Tpr-related protein family member, putative [Theileria annulata]CAI73255.1 Tpr-related protein family member, putative [Theileria annulata]|eukprot:XP_953932.1 Tpr-related protein family member, putative [Theileria annulata]